MRNSVDSVEESVLSYFPAERLMAGDSLGHSEFPELEDAKPEDASQPEELPIG